MIFSISWRNVWRSKIRSLVIISAITLGVFAGVYAIAFIIGWVNQRIDNVINTEVSHVQIHHKDFLQTNEVNDFIPDIKSVKSKIETYPEVIGVSSRVISTCMVTSAETASGVQLTGIDPDNEKKVTKIHSQIIEGSYFENIKSRPIVIGKKLAEKLNVKVRSKVVVTISEMDGTLTGAAFRVAGVYETANTAYDETKAFVRQKDLQSLIKIDKKKGHEIAILLNENDHVDEFSNKMKSEFTDLQVMSWTELLPEMKMMNESMGYMMYIFIVIIMLALGFGIINTMLMAILERTRELGVLIAIGMNKQKIFSMIVLETVLLSLVGGVIGILIAVILTAITYQTGIDLSLWTEGLNSVGFNATIYPVIGFDSIVTVTFLVVIISVLAAIYPALKAVKMNAAEALKIDI